MSDLLAEMNELRERLDAMADGKLIHSVHLSGLASSVSNTRNNIHFTINAWRISRKGKTKKDDWYTMMGTGMGPDLASATKALHDNLKASSPSRSSPRTTHE